jgi:hypothetical protein
MHGAGRTPPGQTAIWCANKFETARLTTLNKAELSIDVPPEVTTMSPSLNENLPAALQSVRTRPLFVMRLDVKPMQVIGATPGAYRRVGPVPGGSFAGERLAGEVLGEGNDWQCVRSDGATTLDARLVLKTRDDALIGMTYRGLRHGAADVLARIDNGESVDPASYYFRITAFFETAAANYGWLNRVLAVGIGDRRRDGPLYSIFEVL